MTPDRLLMAVPHASSLYDGSYRCVSKNGTAPDNSSQVLTIKVHCEYLKMDVAMETFTSSCSIKKCGFILQR